MMALGLLQLFSLRAYSMLKKGGLVIVGFLYFILNPAPHWHSMFLKLIFFYICSYPLALNMIATGKINVKPLITHHFKLEETVQAFETARTGAGGAIKVMISCD